jgi:hypothetical protein
MAEAFSILSGAVSVLDVLLRGATALHELICEWHDAPDEICELFNEVNDSRSALSEACEVWETARATRTDQYLVFSDAIQKEVDQAKSLWEEFEVLLEGLGGGRGTSKAGVRIRWIGRRKKLEKLRKRLRVVRRNVREHISTFNACVNNFF